MQFFGKLYDQQTGIIAWKNPGIWSSQITAWFVKQTILAEWFARPYTLVLPYVECLLGILFLIGYQTRRALIFAALLVITLEAGLLLQLKHDAAALNTVYLLTLLFALQNVRHNRWSLDDYLMKSSS